MGAEGGLTAGGAGTGGAGAAPSDWPAYAYRKGMLTKEQRFRLSPRAMLIEEAEQPVRSVAYEDIADVHLSFVRTKYHDYLRCALKTREGEKILLQNQHYKGFASFEERGAAFSAFVEALHAHLAQFPRQRTYRRGSLAMWSVTLVGFIVLLAMGVGGVVIGKWYILLVPLVAGYRMWPIIARGKPGTYEPRQLPEWIR